MMGRSPDLAQNPIVKVYCSQMVGRSDWIRPRKRLKQVGRPPGGLEGAHGGHHGGLFGSNLGPSRGHQGALGGGLGGALGPPGGLRGPGGPQGARGHLGGLWGALGGPLGALVRPLQPPPPQGWVVRVGGQTRQSGSWRGSSQTRVTSGKSSKIQRS